MRSIASSPCVASPRAPARYEDRLAYQIKRFEARVALVREGVLKTPAGTVRGPHWSYIARQLHARLQARKPSAFLSCKDYEDMQDVIALWQREQRESFLVAPPGIHKAGAARDYLATLLERRG